MTGLLRHTHPSGQPEFKPLIQSRLRFRTSWLYMPVGPLKIILAATDFSKHIDSRRANHIKMAPNGRVIGA